MKARPNDTIQELIAKSLAGETTLAEEKQLRDWLAQGQANRDEFVQFKSTFEAGSKFYASADNVPPIDTEQEWKRFVNAVSDRSDNQRTLSLERNSVTPWLRIAAAVLLLIASGFVINYFVFSDKQYVFETTANTLPVTLPDGSKVLLNVNSRLTYSKSYGESRRDVTLQGEAFFEVARDTTKPFLITTHAANVEVLGTSFDVLAYDNQNEMNVTVQTGKVQLFAPLGDAINLTAGERGVYLKTNKQLRAIPNPDVNFLSWKTRKLVFVEKDLRSVIATINKMYNTNISLTTNVPATCVVTVTFEGQTLDAVLNVLKSTLNLTYENRDGQTKIVGAGC